MKKNGRPRKHPIENHPLFTSATTMFGDYYSLVVSIIDMSSM